MTRDTVSITMSTPILARLRSEATTQKRTLSQQIELLVEKALPALKPSRRAKKGAA